MNIQTIKLQRVRLALAVVSSNCRAGLRQCNDWKKDASSMLKGFIHARVATDELHHSQFMALITGKTNEDTVIGIKGVSPWSEFGDLSMPAPRSQGVRENYVAPPSKDIRAGCQDHKMFESKGIRC